MFKIWIKKLIKLIKNMIMKIKNLNNFKINLKKMLNVEKINT